MNKLLALTLPALLLAGCTTGPDYQPHVAEALGVPQDYSGASSPAAIAGAQADLSAWWQQFDDPLLTRLVSEATSSNLQVAQSAARLVQAREALVRARGEYWPRLGGSAGATNEFTRGGASSAIIGNPRGSSNTYLTLGLDASWQLDIFGRLSRNVEAVRADEQSAEFDLEAVRTSVAAEVATNYINARLGQARLQVARDTLRTQDDNLQIAGWRVQAGLVSSLDVEQARAQRAQTAAAIPAIENSYIQAVHRLSVLTGREPGALRGELEPVAPIPQGAASVAVGIPADTLRNRPDIRSAERQLAAATARIGLASADLYPSLAISGNLNTYSPSLGGLGDLLSGSLFAGLTQTIFDAGARRSQVRSARAGADLAFAAYRQTILSGLEDVENAIQSLQTAREREAELAIAFDAGDAAALYARSQYRSGLIDFLTLLQSEQSLLSARDQLVTARADKALALVQLYLALGGGWQPLPANSTENPA